MQLRLRLKIPRWQYIVTIDASAGGVKDLVQSIVILTVSLSS